MKNILFSIRKILVLVGTLGRYTVYSTAGLMALTYRQINRLRERLAERIEQGEVTQEQADAIIDSLESKRAAAVAKIAGMLIKRRHLPLLAAISKTYLAASIQMKMIRRYADNSDGTTTVVHIGFSYLDDAEISDIVELPAEPGYWLVNVQIGDEHRDQSPHDAEVMIRVCGRSCLTATEAIALGTHTDVLLQHYVDAPGSRWSKDADYVPNLSLNGFMPLLYIDNIDRALAKWGSGSCRERV